VVVETYAAKVVSDTEYERVLTLRRKILVPRREQ